VFQKCLAYRPGFKSIQTDLFPEVKSAYERVPTGRPEAGGGRLSVGGGGRSPVGLVELVTASDVLVRPEVSATAGGDLVVGREVAVVVEAVAARQPHVVVEQLPV
jgi:hypothetical protein